MVDSGPECVPERPVDIVAPVRRNQHRVVDGHDVPVTHPAVQSGSAPRGGRLITPAGESPAVDRIALSTVVYAPREEVFDLLLEFPRYTRYSEYLTDVERDGDGGAGTDYRLRFAWWRLSYTVHSAVTAVERPSRIEWRLTRHLDAEGFWATAPADPPAGESAATRIRFEVSFDPHSAEPDAVSLPRFVSLDTVVDRVRPVVVDEAERVVERAVADVEGRRRDVDVVYHDRPDTV